RSFLGPETGGNMVDILGSGFSGATAVTFGGVAASDFTVMSDSVIETTAPAFGSTTTCTQDGSLFGETRTDDVCQVQVVWTNASGSRDQSTILPLYEGPVLAVNPNGVSLAPPGEEVAPQPDEYDYLPAPTITSISTSNGPGSLASEFGGTLVTITGKGFNPIGLQFIHFGDPNEQSTEDPFWVTVTGTQIQLVAPGLFPLTFGPAALPVTVTT